MTLPPSLKTRFDADGHFSPIKIFSPEEAAQVYQDYRHYFARQCGPFSLVESLAMPVSLMSHWFFME